MTKLVELKAASDAAWDAARDDGETVLDDEVIF